MRCKHTCLVKGPSNVTTALHYMCSRPFKSVYRITSLVSADSQMLLHNCSYEAKPSCMYGLDNRSTFPKAFSLLQIPFWKLLTLLETHCSYYCVIHGHVTVVSWSSYGCYCCSMVILRLFHGHVTVCSWSCYGCFMIMLRLWVKKDLCLQMGNSLPQTSGGVGQQQLPGGPLS